MEIFVFRTAADWEKGNGAAVVVAESLKSAEEQLQDYENEPDLRCYESDHDASTDPTGPFRLIWVLLEALPTQDQAERVIVSAWDEAP